MKRVRIRTVEDLKKLPEGEWVEAIGRTKVVSYFEGAHIEDGRLIVPLPAQLLEAFSGGSRGPLRASIRRGKLVVEKRRAKRHA